MANNNKNRLLHDVIVTNSTKYKEYEECTYGASIISELEIHCAKQLRICR